MRDVTELIDQAEAADDQEPVIRALLASGPEALRQVLRVVEARSASYLPALYETIRRSTYPEALPVLLDKARSSSAAAVHSVFHALGASGDDAALAFVLERLTDAKELTVTRAAAAHALYGVDRPEVRAALRATVEDEGDDPSGEEWPILLVNAVTALATMNDHSGAGILYRLQRSDHESARALAVGAFRIVLDSDTLHHLIRVSGDPSIEVRRALVDPLFLLGLPASAALLLRLAAEDPDAEVSRNCAVRFGDVMGLDISGTEDLPFAKENWERVRADLDPAVCYRFGEAINLDELIDEFVEEAGSRDDLARELTVLTGIDVALAHATDGVAAVRQATEDVPFVPGRIHKWGYPRPAPATLN